MKVNSSKNSVIIRDFKTFKNEKGLLNYSNSFKLSKYKRLYTITHNSCKTVRAWQGHPYESKCFIPIYGKFIISWVEIDDFKNPSNDLKANHIIIKASDKKIIEIPKGYANGLKALESNSEVLVLSEFFLEDSLKEKIRFDSNLWFDWKMYDKK